MLANMPLEIRAKVFHRGLQGIGGAGRQRTKRGAGSPHVALGSDLVQIAWLPSAILK
jgi:hypothetical protein